MLDRLKGIYRPEVMKGVKQAWHCVVAILIAYVSVVGLFESYAMAGRVTVQQIEVPFFIFMIVGVILYLASTLYKALQRYSWKKFWKGFTWRTILFAWAFGMITPVLAASELGALAVFNSNWMFYVYGLLIIEAVLYLEPLMKAGRVIYEGVNAIKRTQKK